MKKSLARFARTIIFLGIGVLLVWLVTHHLTAEQKQKILLSLKGANYWILGGTMILGIFSHLARAVRWKMLIQPMGYQPRTFSTFCAVMIGYLANLALPRMGEITRCGMLSRYERIPADKLLGTVITERAIDAIMLILLLLVTLFLELDKLGHFFYHQVILKLENRLATYSYTDIAWLIAIAVAAGLIIYWLIRKFNKTNIYQKIKNVFTGIGEGLASVAKMKNKGLFIIYSLGIWLLYLAMVYTAFFCLNETSGLSVGAALAALAFGSIGMIVTQGGIGAYQWIVQQVLLLYGIHEAAGYAFGWISWLSQTALIVVVGFICLFLLPLISKKRLAIHRTYQTENIPAS